MNAKKCDACGKYYSELFAYRFYMMPNSFITNPAMKLDFCEECQKKLDAFPAYYISVKDSKKEDAKE